MLTFEQLEQCAGLRAQLRQLDSALAFVDAAYEGREPPLAVSIAGARTIDIDAVSLKLFLETQRDLVAHRLGRLGVTDIPGFVT